MLMSNVRDISFKGVCWPKDIAIGLNCGLNITFPQPMAMKWFDSEKQTSYQSSDFLISK